MTFTTLLAWSIVSTVQVILLAAAIDAFVEDIKPRLRKGILYSILYNTVFITGTLIFVWSVIEITTKVKL